MKRTFLLLLIVLSFSYGCKTNTVHPQDTVENFKLIPNYDFENWEPSFSQGWFLPGWTTNNTMAISTTEVAPDSLNAYHGHYAMRLLSQYMFLAYAKTKFPITVHPLSLRAYIKCNLVPPDTVSIRIRLFFKGKETDSGAWLGTKSIENYKQITIPVSQHSTLADSALIEIRLRSARKNKLGKDSKFWVDYLSFLLTQ